MALEQPMMAEGNFRYPVDYRIFHVGDHIALRLNTEGNNPGGEATRKFYKVVKRKKVFPIIKQDETNWLLASGAKKNAETIDDFLETLEGNLLVMCMGIESDREIQVQLYQSASTKVGGTNKDPDAVVTPTSSPLYEPTVVLYAWKEDMPNFVLENLTEYTVRFVMLGFFGFSYSLMPTAHNETSLPPKFETIDLTPLRGG